MLRRNIFLRNGKWQAVNSKKNISKKRKSLFLLVYYIVGLDMKLKIIFAERSLCCMIKSFP